LAVFVKNVSEFHASILACQQGKGYS